MTRQFILIAGYSVGVLGLIFAGAPEYAFAMGALLMLIAFLEPIVGYAVAFLPDREHDGVVDADDLRRRLRNMDRV